MTWSQEGERQGLLIQEWLNVRNYKITATALIYIAEAGVERFREIERNGLEWWCWSVLGLLLLSHDIVACSFDGDAKTDLGLVLG